MDEMESLRIEGELERQKASLRASRPNSTAENRDSGVADMELLTTTIEKNGALKADSTLKRSALSNSLLDIHEAEGSGGGIGGQTLRRGSVGSLDSGMSVISFQSTSPTSTEATTAATTTAAVQRRLGPPPHTNNNNNSSFLGQLFRPRRASRVELNPTGVEV